MRRRTKVYAMTAVTVIVAIAIAFTVSSVGPEVLERSLRLAVRLGPGGLVAYLGYSLFVFVLLGAAWWVPTGTPPARLGLFVHARLLREAASDLLPFSQVGGIVIALDFLSARGMSAPIAAAALIVDLMTEIMSQLLFTMVVVATSIALFTSGATPGIGTPLVAAGAVVLWALAIALGAAPAALALARRLLARALPTRLTGVGECERHLRAMYGRRGRLAATLLLNGLAWIASAWGAWLVLRLMGVDAPVHRVIALECMVFLVRSAAFAVPAGIGVQEAGYAVLGVQLGLPVEAVVLLALVKRVRDLVLAVPVLLAWQVGRWQRVLQPNRSMDSP